MQSYFYTRIEGNFLVGFLCLSLVRDGLFWFKKVSFEKNGITGKSCSYFAEKNSDFCRTASFLRENDDRIRGFLDVQFFFAWKKKGRNKFHACTLFKLAVLSK